MNVNPEATCVALAIVCFLNGAAPAPAFPRIRWELVGFALVAMTYFT